MPPEKGTMPSHHSACGDAVLLRIVHCGQGTPIAFGDNRSRHCPRCEQVPRDCQSGAFGKPPVSKEDQGRCHVPKRAQAPAPTEESPGHYRAQGVAAPDVTEPGTLPRPNAARPIRPIRPIRRIRCRARYGPTSRGRRTPERCESQALPWRRPRPCRAISRAR